MDLAAANTRPGSAARLSERGTASSSAPAAGPSTDSSKGAEQSGDGTIWRTRVEGAFTIEEEIRPSLSWVDIFSPTKRVEALREEVNLIRGTAPYAARLLGETLTIAPARTIVVVGGNFLKGFIPSLGLKATGELIRAVSCQARVVFSCARPHFSAHELPFVKFSGIRRRREENPRSPATFARSKRQR